MDQPKASGTRSPAAASTLHDIVLDYVINNAYAGTARVLATSPYPVRSSSGASTPQHMDVDDDEPDDGDVDIDDDPVAPQLDDAVIASIDQRRAIIDHILNGAIVHALDALHAHFPAVLSPPERNGSSNGASTSNGNGAPSASFVLTPRVQPRRDSTSTPTPSVPPAAIDTHATPVFARSAEPDHVRLNLQIQEFIESFRPQGPSAASSPASSVGSLTGNGASSSAASSQLFAAVTALKGLHTEAMHLRPDHRAVYLQEIKDVGALFAYKDPESSPVGGFLNQGRRIALAQQVNAAILRSEGRPVQSHLEQIARQTTAVYATLGEHGIDAQPSWTGDGKGDPKVAAHWRIAQQLKGRPFARGTFSLHEYVRELA